MNDIEFYLLLSQCNNEAGFDSDNYRIVTYDLDDVIVDFNNQSDFEDALSNQYYIYYIDEDYYSNDLSIRLMLKPMFKEFNDPKLFSKSKCYQHLYGITINKELKRLIMFLFNLNSHEQKNYIKQCPDYIKDGLIRYFSLVYESEPDSNENEESYQHNENLA